MSITGVALTDVGQKRKINEDYYGFFPEPGLFIVADGMGGHVAGSTASQLAVDKIREFFSDTHVKNEVLSNSVFKEDLDPLALKLKKSVEYANYSICSAAEQDANLDGMGSTIVCLWLNQRAAYVAHVGDSRLYRIRSRQISSLTQDHSLVYELFKQGEITLEEMQQHPKRHIITRALGMPQVRVELQQIQWQAGDCFLLCTDGLNSMVLDEELLSIILSSNDLKTAAQSLVDLANQRGGSDNITLIILEVK